MIPYAKPSITPLEIDYVTDAVSNGWGTRCYDYIHRFENEFRELLGVSYAHATSSCTGAITLSLTALGVGSGDEVIIADANWIAALSPIIHLGAIPIFADVSLTDWCLTLKEVERLSTSKTRAVIVTHLYGNLAPVEQICEWAKQRGIFVIEDAAEALGSKLQNRFTGTFGDVGVFSFHGTKTATTGEGGMVVTQDEQLYERLVQLNNHGRAASRHLDFVANEPGFKFKISNIQAALGCAQIERIEELIEDKRRVFHEYSQNLQGAGLALNPEGEGNRNSYWMTTVVAHEGGRNFAERALKLMREEQIDARPFFPPLSSFEFVDGVGRANSLHLFQRGVNLPSYFGISSEEIQKVSLVIRSALD